MPTKIGEFFSKGVPIVCNRFNHDIEEIVNDKNGYLLNFESIKLIDLIKIENLIHLSKSEIHEYAKNYFSPRRALTNIRESTKSYLSKYCLTFITIKFLNSGHQTVKMYTMAFYKYFND